MHVARVKPLCLCGFFENISTRIWLNFECVKMSTFVFLKPKSDSAHNECCIVVGNSDGPFDFTRAISSSSTTGVTRPSLYIVGKPRPRRCASVPRTIISVFTSLTILNCRFNVSLRRRGGGGESPAAAQLACPVHVRSYYPSPLSIVHACIFL